MHCNSCVKLIKEELDQLAGVSNTEIDFKSGKGSVLLDLKLNKPDDIIKAVAEAGYQARLENEKSI